MILEQEAIEVYKLRKLVEYSHGVVSSLSTDCAACVFPTNDLPFDLLPGGPNLGQISCRGR